MENRYNVGDMITPKYLTSIKESTGKIINIANIPVDDILRTLYEVEFYNKTRRIFYEREIRLIDLEYLKEKEKRKEELRLKHINIDPFGEEDWSE